MAVLSKEQEQSIRTIIIGTDTQATEKLIIEAERIGQRLAEMKFATSQIRNIFGIVRTIEQLVDRKELEANPNESPQATLHETAYRDLQLLKPKLAYQYGRATNTPRERKKDAMELLKDTLSLAIDCVGRDRARFTHFVEFFEAILAYHRAAEGVSKK
ncbi:MAG: type III-A CRISPR-associated protein Csm2 [Oscillochloris sp.]|nr:type III-A CRISPR-associated protein Csm2 [Oscillochloris sp.]